MQQGDYQTAFARLEAIANILEEGNLPLEESLKLYEEGNKLANDLRIILEKAEQKITIMPLEEGKEQ
jgi:exodeoxyribonuclease VII small subunit